MLILRSWNAKLDMGDPKDHKKHAEWRAKLRAANLGKKQSAETRAKLSKAGKGRSPSPETRAKLSKANRGKKRTPEQCAWMSAQRRGKGPKSLSPEHRRKIGLANTGRKVSAATRLKISIANTGHKDTPEQRRRKSEAHKGMKHKKETIAKIVAVHRGRERSAETRARISASLQGKKMPPVTKEHRANLSKALIGKVRTLAMREASSRVRSRRHLGVAANSIIYIMRNNDYVRTGRKGGRLKVGQSKTPKRRRIAIKAAGIPLDSKNPIWRKDSDIEILFQRRVKYTNDAELEIQQELNTYFETTSKPFSQVLPIVNEICDRWDG